jgi:ferric-dicitrate binding protein FerR (iron transport regulator)
LLSTIGFAIPAKQDARVTQVIREVNLLPADAAPRRAVLNENVRETTAVKTGGDSRAELTFIDLTITRLGANTLYSFKNAGRRVELRSGSTLLRVPKDSGGATIVTSAVTAGSTGTTFIFENIGAGGARLTVLEGSARLTLVKHPDQTGNVRAGQSLEVPPGASRIPQPAEVDLDRLMKTSPLIVGFRPLPSQNLINNAIRQQQQRGPLNQPNRNAPPGPQNQPAPQPPPGPGR